MENQQKHHGFFNNGFILGIIIGVCVTLLFTTKRGKRILSLLTEEGLQRFTDLERILDHLEEEYVGQAGEKDGLEQKETTPIIERKPHKVIKKQVILQKQHQPQRRFFKGVSRKLASIN